MQYKDALIKVVISLLVFLLFSGIFTGGVFAWIYATQSWCTIYSDPWSRCVEENNVTQLQQMYFIHKRNFGDYFSDGHGYVKCNTNNCSNDCGITLPLYDTYYCSQRGEEYEIYYELVDNALVVVIFGVIGILTSCCFGCHFRIYPFIWCPDPSELKKETNEPKIDVENPKIDNQTPNDIKSDSSSESDIELDTESDEKSNDVTLDV